MPDLPELDEPDFPEHASQVAEALAAGPRQPRAKTTVELEKQRRQQANQDRVDLEFAVKHGPEFIAKLPARLQDEAKRRRAELVAEGQRRSGRHEQLREPVTLPSSGHLASPSIAGLEPEAS